MVHEYIAIKGTTETNGTTWSADLHCTRLTNLTNESPKRLITMQVFFCLFVLNVTIWACLPYRSMVNPWQSASLTQQDIIKRDRDIGKSESASKVGSTSPSVSVKCYTFLKRPEIWIQYKKENRTKTNKKFIHNILLKMDHKYVYLVAFRKTQVEYLCSRRKVLQRTVIQLLSECHRQV